jgi:diguanylate cyclase (GGDEF)-like protein
MGRCNEISLHRPPRVHLALAVIAAVFGTPLQALDPTRAVTQYLRSSWQAEQGLPQNSVSAILRTRDGWLWAGTERGLVRFDGVRFTVFDRDNTPALPANGINAIHEDRDGRLWIGTSRGLVRRQGSVFERIDPAAGDLRIASLLEDHAGRLWVGSLGNGLFEVKAEKLVALGATIPLPGRRIRALREAADGALWIATEAGIASLAAGRMTSLAVRDGLLDDSCFDLWPDADGTLWVGTDGGLQRYRQGVFTAFTAKQGLTSNRIRTLWRDRAGSLWIGTQGGGLDRLRRDGQTIEVLDTTRGLSSDVINAISEDGEGNLWLGSSGGGLIRLRDGKVATFGRAEGLPADIVYAIFEDRAGSLWFGMNTGGVARLRGGALTVFDAADGLPSETVTSIAEDAAGTLWAGTYGGGLARFANERFTTPVAAGQLADPSVYALLPTRGGGLWVGTGGGGLDLLEAGRVTHTTVADGLPGGFVQALLEDPAGALWIGTNEGLARLAGGRLTRWTTADGLADRSVLSLHLDAAGVLWIGTAGGGLSRFADGHFATVTSRQGLSDDTIGRILEDRSGRLWMSGDRGLSAVARSSLDDLLAGRRERVVPLHLGAGDGMRSAECYGGTQPAGIAGRDGRLWFPTIRGAVVLDPDHLPTNAAPPPVVIEAVLVDGRATPASDGLRLAPGSHSFELEYTALSLREPARTRFRYRLEGFDPAWTEAGARRTAYYTGLPHGDYRFQVIAANEDGVWNERGASLDFVVAPSLGETWWFRLLAAAALAAALYGTYRLRVWRLEARQRELEAVVDVRTRELSTANRELARLANLDGLTQIPNRRSFDEALHAAWADHRRRGAPLAVVLADVDFFKPYNDRCGHPAGDRALTAVAQALDRSIRRETDLAARYGGEEMVILLRDTDAAGATRVAENALAAVHALAISHPASDAAPILTLSIGVAAVVPTADVDPADLVAAADQALYRAKAEGRNRVAPDRVAPDRVAPDRVCTG